MILHNNLYEITSSSLSPKGYDYNIHLHADSIIYQAHFPGQPITPGVCILQIATEIAEHIIGKRLFVKMVKNIKFLQIITPTTTPDVCFSMQCDLNDTQDIVKIQTTVRHQDETFAKLSFTCQIA